MSYEQLAASVDALSDSNNNLVDQVLATQALSNAAVAAAESEVAKAQQAADAAQLAAKVYDTIANGLAATAVNGYFSVVATDNKEFLILYKNNSGVELEVKRYPSALIVGATRLTSGDVFGTINTYGQALNGGVMVLGSDGRTIGVTIPAGQTGDTSYVRAQLGLQNQIANLVGTKIQIDVYFDATPNFLSTTLMTSLVMQVLRSGSIFTVTPDSQSLTQEGSIIHKVVTYTIQAGDSDVYPVFRPGASTTGSIRTAVMKSVIYSINSQPAGYASWSDYHLQQRLQPISDKLASNTITSGEKMDGNLYAWGGEALGGATRVVDTKGNLIGLSVPSGSSGATSYISPFFKVDGAKLAGSTISVTAVFNTTANFTTDCPPGGTALQVKRNGSSVNVAALNLKISQVGTVVTKTFDYVLTSADLAIAPTYQIGAAVAMSSVRSITVSSMKYTLSGLPAGLTSADAMLAVQVNAAVSVIPVRGVENTVVVADSGGNFISLSDANISLASASLANPTTVIMKHDEDTVNVSLNDYVSVVGGSSSPTLLHHEMPANVAPASIPGQQTLYVLRNNRLENLRITAKNMRYPVHCESGGVFRNGTIEVVDCDIEHLGNQEAQDYQDSISSGITVWASEHAWGYGASSGQKLLISRSKLKSRTSAFYVHTNIAFDKPLDMRVEYSELTATSDGGKSVYVQPLGSGQHDRLTLVGNKLAGDVYYWMNPWMPNTLDYQPANHSEITISGSGNSPAVFVISESGRALKIKSSADGVTSSVSVTGNAAPIVFGKESYALPGCDGNSGYVYGYGDISGVNVGSPSVGNITSLGKRLGDCTASNKTLNVLIDGVTNKSIVFNQNYTAQSNATIIATINTALAGLAVASEYNIGGRYRPAFTDEEMSLLNNSSSGILMGMALAYDGHHKKVRKMTSSDGVDVFAGIAWEDIYPGKFGRVKTKGYLPSTDLYGTIGVLAFGQPIYVSASTPGQLTTATGSVAVMKAIRSDAVEVSRK